MANRLAQETSPYLLQHADNPVDWMAWGPEALARAKAENKPILLSVGYAACHWCHVMAHECFENPQIAGLMNERFVNIKVDREERPDIDTIYQTALAMMGQQGGWPLTMFLTPDGAPFWGGTYFPPEDAYGRPGFPAVLNAIGDTYASEPDRVAHNVTALTGGLGTLDAMNAQVATAAEEQSAVCNEVNANVQRIMHAAEHLNHVATASEEANAALRAVSSRLQVAAAKVTV